MAGSPSDDLSARLREIIGEQSRLRDTEHFTIAYDTTTETLVALTARLEATHTSVERFCEGLGLAVASPPDRLGVLFFNEYADYASYCQDYGVSSSTAAGFYDQRSNLAAFVNTLNSPRLKRS